MAATGLQVNWTAATFTPTSGSPTTINALRSARVDSGGSLIKFSGSNDRGPRVVVNDFNEPIIEVETGDIAAVMALLTGTAGSFTITHKDAKLGSLGDIVWTMNPCVVGSPRSDGQHRQFGNGSIRFEGYFADGQTHPLSYSRA